MPWKSTLHPCNGVRSVSGPWRIAKQRRPGRNGRGLRCAPSLSGSPVSYPEGATPAPDYTSSRNLITKVLDFVQFGGPKPKPRWDVHLPGAGNRGGGLAGVFRPLIAGSSGSAVSPRLSGWSARPGICRPSPLPTQGQARHRRPAAQAQIASGLLSRPTPASRSGVEVRAVARQSLPS